MHKTTEKIKYKCAIACDGRIVCRILVLRSVTFICDTEDGCGIDNT